MALEKHTKASVAALLTRERILPSLAVLFVSAVWIPASVAAILLLAGVRNYWIPAGILIGTLLTLLCLRLFRGLHRGEVWRLAIIVLGITGAAALVSIFFYDVSTDGRWYHADAILALLHGINPIYSEIPAVQPVWANHYPKATWYFAAIVIHTFHSYQLGKIYNFLLIFSCGAYAADFFHRLGLNRRYSAVLALATALNPVAAAQMMTYYVDGALASLLALVVMASVNLLFHRASMDRVIFFLAASLAIAIKFTAVPYVGVIVCILMAAHLLSWRFWRAASWQRSSVATSACAAAALCFGVMVLGFSPYMTNMSQGLHPMYPVLGPNKIDVITPISPPSFLNHSYNPAQKFLISFLGQTAAHFECSAISRPADHSVPVPNCVEATKIPFTVGRNEFQSLGVPDARIAGWGLFFSGVTLGSLALLLCGKGWRGNKPVVLALMLVAITCCINPVSWCARYAPQLALLPVFLLVPALRTGSRWTRMAARVLCAFLVVNNLLWAGGAAGASFIKSQKLERSFSAIARTSGPGDYWAYRNPEKPGGFWFNSYAYSKLHYEQFSGHQGIVICGQVDSTLSSLPSGGFPIGMNMRGVTEVTLYKGRCSAGQPF